MTDQLPKKSRTSLATFVGTTLSACKKIVVVPGYSEDQFGYYVCTETFHVAEHPRDDFYTYNDAVSFTPKTSNDTYQVVVSTLRQ